MAGRVIGLILVFFICFLIYGCTSGCQPSVKPVFPKKEKKEIIKLTPDKDIEFKIVKDITTGYYVKNGTISLSTLSDPKSFNILLANESSTILPLSFLFNGLVEINIQGQIEPALAKKWEVRDNGKTWIFYLRKGVKWFDEKPFTADDVVFTFNKIILNKNIPNAFQDNFTIKDKPVEIKKIDDYTVKFILPYPFAPFLREMDLPIVPKHILEEYVNKGTFQNTWDINTPPNKIVGTGPFMISEYVSGQYIIMKRNHHYWKTDNSGQQLPYLFKVVWYIVPDRHAQMLKFKANNIDVLDRIRPADYNVFKPGEQAGNYKVYNTGPSFDVDFLVFNQNPKKDKNGISFVDPVKLKWFSNLKFRRAIAYAIDRKAIQELVYLNLATPQYSPLSMPNKTFYNPNVKTYTYDIEKAKTLLKEIGFSWKNNKLFDDKGNLVSFNIATNAENNERITVANLIRADLNKLGMDVRLVPLQFNTLTQKISATYKWEAILMGLTGELEPNKLKIIWLSSGRLHVWYPEQTKPATVWEAEIDDIFQKAAVEMDLEKRKKLYNHWQELVAENLPIIVTVCPSRLSVIKNSFGNVNPSAIGETLRQNSNIIYNLETFYIKE